MDRASFPAMVRTLKWAAVMGLALGLAGCGGRPDLDDFADMKPELELERFLSGKLTAHGVFQDRLGDVRRIFVADIVGEWDGKVLTLTEDFVYEDGSTERRIWRLTQTGPETWSGQADGVIGEALGREAGNAFNFSYTIDLNTPDGTFRAHFDDWLWKIDNSAMINRAYVSKYGFDIGELVISFHRETPLTE